MTYTKPEVAVLGDATRVIEASKTAVLIFDPGYDNNEVGASYDTEE